MVELTRPASSCRLNPPDGAADGGPSDASVSLSGLAMASWSLVGRRDELPIPTPGPTPWPALPAGGGYPLVRDGYAWDWNAPGGRWVEFVLLDAYEVRGSSGSVDGECRLCWEPHPLDRSPDVPPKKGEIVASSSRRGRAIKLPSMSPGRCSYRSTVPTPPALRSCLARRFDR